MNRWGEFYFSIEKPPVHFLSSVSIDLFTAMDTFVNAPGELAVHTFLLITMYVTMYMNLSTGHLGIILWGTFRERTFETSEARFERRTK